MSKLRQKFFARSRFPSLFQYFSKNELFKHVLRPGTYLGTRVLTRRVRGCAVRPQRCLVRRVMTGSLEQSVYRPETEES